MLLTSTVFKNKYHEMCCKSVRKESTAKQNKNLKYEFPKVVTLLYSNMTYTCLVVSKVSVLYISKELVLYLGKLS